MGQLAVPLRVPKRKKPPEGALMIGLENIRKGIDRVSYEFRMISDIST